MLSVCLYKDLMVGHHRFPQYSGRNTSIATFPQYWQQPCRHLETSWAEVFAKVTVIKKKPATSYMLTTGHVMPSQLISWLSCKEEELRSVHRGWPPTPLFSQAVPSPNMRHKHIPATMACCISAGGCCLPLHQVVLQVVHLSPPHPPWPLLPPDQVGTPASHGVCLEQLL